MRTVLIVEDVAETRRWLGALVCEAFPGATLHEAPSLRRGLAAMVEESFDIALIDLGLPDGSGLDVVRQFTQHAQNTLCVVTTAMGDDASIVGALSAGAQGYLLKDQPRELLVAQLRQLVDGVPALSPSVARRIMQHFQRTGPAAPCDALTVRETEVLALIGRGLRNAEVAHALSLSEYTVASYIKEIYRKLGISSRAEASWHAARMGLSNGEPSA